MGIESVVTVVIVGAFALFLAYKIGRRGGKKRIGVVAAANDFVRHPFEENYQEP